MGSFAVQLFLVLALATQSFSKRDPWFVDIANKTQTATNYSGHLSFEPRPLNAKTADDIGGYHITDDQKDEIEDLYSYEVLDFDGERTSVRVSLTFPDIKEVPVTLESPPLKRGHRGKRAIFGTDTRFAITAESARQFPFSAIAKTSNGCSGMLISKKHILTAAHCVHDGVDYVDSVSQLKIGLPRLRAVGQGGNLIWFPVRRVLLPNGWILSEDRESSLAFDYAVIQLRRSLPRPPLEVGVADDPESVYFESRLHFASYDDEKMPDVVMYGFCEPRTETANLIYHNCDTTPGSVGAGMYRRNIDKTRKAFRRQAVAVHSGMQNVTFPDGIVEYVNAAVRITPLKFAQICQWVKGDFSKCRQ